MMSKWCRALAFSCLLPASVFAQGSQQPQAEVDLPASSPSAPFRPPRLYSVYKAGVAARLNPLGLFLSGALAMRYRLYDSDALALRENHVAIGPTVFLTPASARAGVALELQPLSVLQLSASYEFLGYFGTFQFNQSFASPASEASDRQLNALQAAKTNYATYGGILTLAALVQVKVGPVALRSNMRAFDFMMRLREGDRVHYEPVLDVLAPGNGWVITDDTDVLYVTRFGFTAGLRYTVTHAFFGARDFDPSELGPGSEAAYTLNSPIHRLGPLLAYTFFDDEQRKFNAPTLALLAQWHLRHRYRAGQETSQAFPWLGLAFQFKGII